ncbi:MAG TPA: serine hydrolase domain-containing protein [Acidimicrobiales bacterium]|nr:serine hydrolase domain-containing protein [Acidimicrobiales bacterium]
MSATLPRTRASLQVGFDSGWHVGVQLAVWRDGEPLLTLAQGVARPGVAMTDDSLIAWFSGTKLVTATAVVQLWDRGLLDLDQTVASVIPEFSAHGKEAVTIAHLLTHTGGFRRLGGTGNMFVGGIEPEALSQAIYESPLEDGWVPGARAGYHPVTGFHVLGEIVRRVDGRSFEAYVSEEIFERLGMADSWVTMPPERVRAYGDRIVTMHDTAVSPPRILPRFLKDTGFGWVEPSGSAVGPMTDLVRLAEALRRSGELGGERILSPQAVSAMTRRVRAGMRDETFGAVMDWGLGAMVNSWHYAHQATPYGYGDHAGRDAFGHGGRQCCLVFADPEHGLSVAFAANGMPGEANNQRRTQPVITALYEDLGLAPVTS